MQTTTPPSAVAAVPACPSCIPALTPVDLVIDAPIGSGISKSGDKFPIHLGKPIVVDGRELVPAGTKGQGEVIHAKKSGASGSAGELVLAANYLEVGDRQLRLRSMHLSQVGANNDSMAFAVGITVGLPALFITGKNTSIMPGAHAQAKTAEEFVMELAKGAESPAPAAVEGKSPAQAVP